MEEKEESQPRGGACSKHPPCLSDAKVGDNLGKQRGLEDHEGKSADDEHGADLLAGHVEAADV